MEQIDTADEIVAQSGKRVDGPLTTSDTREGLIRTVAVIALLYATYWVYWRWTSTMNTSPSAIVPSVILLVAETWAYLNMCMFVMLTWRLTEREPGPAPPGRTVDVFI
ncbi:MAG TPA: hypothetical protein VFO55_14105, partial [Gemmatimonadaceae bacterium]|nr:hypothetical protein [Gemmatimonadaceae bacterium]